MRNIRRQNILGIIAVLLVLVFANVISSYLFRRFDLTSEKRYTLSESTKDVLKGLDDQVLFRVYLEGDDLPAEYRRFRNDIKNKFHISTDYFLFEEIDGKATFRRRGSKR